MTPIPVDPRLSPDQAYHREYGSPLYPVQGWKWEFNSTTERLVPSISDEPSRHVEPRFALPKLRRLYRWHPDEGHYSLVREDDDDGEAYDDNLYEYDAERLLFKRYQPLLKPLHANETSVIRKLSLNPKHRRVDDSLYGSQTATTLSPEATNTAEMTSTNMTQRTTSSSA